MKKNARLTMCIVLLSTLAPTLTPVCNAASGWTHTYGGASTESASTVVQTTDEGYALAGYTMSYGAGGKDFWLVKTDSSGNKQWSKTYGGQKDDEAYSLVQTTDGGYALAGYTKSYGAGGEDFWLVKTESSGNKLWSKTYGGTKDDVSYSVVQTRDGGYVLGGGTGSYGAGGSDFWLVRTDSSGNELWSKTYGGTKYDCAFSIVQTGDGGYALAGDTDSYGAGESDFWLVKTDSSGNTQWNKTYGGTDLDEARSVIQTRDEGYALAGETASFSTGGSLVWLVKTDSSGNTQWNQTYVGTEAYSVVQTRDGGYALAGETYYNTAGYRDFQLIKTDSAGNMEWSQTYGGSGGDGAKSLIQTRDGGYAVAGETNSYGAGDYDMWLVKTDANGSVPEFSFLFIPPLLVATTLMTAMIHRRVRPRRCAPPDGQESIV